MKTFTEPLQGLKEFADLESALPKLSGVVQISGCIDAAKPHMMYSVNNGSGNRIIVTFHEQRAKEIWEEYRFFDKRAAYYPAKDILFYQSDIRGNVLTAERINALKLLAEEQSCTIITTFDALMNPMPEPEKFIQAVKRIAVGDEVDLKELTRHLAELGYEKNYQAESQGEFSVRGGIVDIFPLTEENPVRIELWGDEVDSIRSFDAESQRSIENLNEVSIYPACGAGADRGGAESWYRAYFSRGKKGIGEAAQGDEDRGSLPCAVRRRADCGGSGRAGDQCRIRRVSVLFL